MDKQTRAEVIAALCSDKYSGFKDGDEAMLETASDARLDEFRANADDAKNQLNVRTRLETNLTQTQARLKVAEERIKALEQPMDEEDFIARAPESIKQVITDIKAAEASERAALINGLKDRGVHSEDELKKQSLDQLKTLARYAHVDVPDFSGRALPREQRSASENKTYAPPDPYAPGLRVLRGESKAVN